MTATTTYTNNLTVPVDPSGLRWCWKACGAVDFVDDHRVVLGVGALGVCAVASAGWCLVAGAAAAGIDTGLDIGRKRRGELGTGNLLANSLVNVATVGGGQLLPELANLAGRSDLAVRLAVGQMFNSLYRVRVQGGLMGIGELAKIAATAEPGVSRNGK